MSVKITHLKNRILSDLQKKWTLDELAKSANIAKSQLTKLFQTELGISPVQYVRNVRLEKSCELLETTLLRIKEIMFAVGIHDQSHFVRDFKKKFVFTPTEYRERFYNKPENK